MPRRVIHIIYSLDTGGAEHVLLKTLPLLNDDFKHLIITLKRPGELADRFKHKGIQVLSLNSSSLIDLAYKHKLFRFVASEKPDLIITHLFYADLVGRLLLQRKNGAPVISSLVSTYNFNKYWPARLFERLTRSLAQHYFANSEAVKDFYTNKLGVNPSKITIIHNGIDTTVFEKVDTKNIVRELNIPKNRVVITMVANLAVNKGHRFLIEAFNKISLTHPEVYVLIVGEGEERANLESQIAATECRDKIKLLGRRHDIPIILSLTNIFVLPTLFEGLSNAILEAMAAECAVVTTDLPENRVMIKHNKTGLLVPVKDSVALQSTLEELIQDKAKQAELGRNARKFIKDNFELRKIANQFDLAIKNFARKKF